MNLKMITAGLGILMGICQVINNGKTFIAEVKVAKTDETNEGTEAKEAE